jgi:mannose-1-phosphate guanylyltransferase
MPLPSYAVILAGGYGTRFWPLSRRARPKQFLNLAGRQSLLQQTYRRLAPLFPRDHIFVVGSAEHSRLLRRQLPRLKPGRLLLEPAARNTAAAIALAAEHIRAALPAGEPDAVLAVFPADHAIRNQAGFRRTVHAALRAAAAEDAMVVLGIKPTHPHTGYGYIEAGKPLRRVHRQPLFAVRRFTEKPDLRTADRYLRRQRFYWNSGMFFWRLSTFDRLLARHLPRTRASMGKLARKIGRRDYARSARALYRRLENISVDYALAEPAAAARRARLIPAGFDWTDLGSWSAAYDWRAASKAENIVPGAHFVLDAHGNWLAAPDKFVAAIGVDDLIVVDTPDALLLCPRARAQEVGKVVDYLRRKKRTRLL